MGALENFASINSYLTVGIRYASAVTHKTACLNIQPRNVHGGNGMVRGQRIDLLEATEEDRVGINQKCLNATPNKAFECTVKAALGACVSDYYVKPERTSRGMQIRYNYLDVRVGRIGEKTDDFCRGNEFAQNLEPLRRHLHLEKADARNIATRPVEAPHKTQSDRIGSHVEYDGNRRSRILRGGQRRSTAHSNNDGNLPSDQIGSKRGQPIKLTLGPAEFDRHVMDLDKAGFAQAAADCGYKLGIRRCWRSQDADHRPCRLLRARRERPRGRRAAENGDELASLHSITSSARASRLSGTVRPSAFAVLRLLTSSYFVGACTGRSTGFSPLRMRSP